MAFRPCLFRLSLWIVLLAGVDLPHERIDASAVPVSSLSVGALMTPQEHIDRLDQRCRYLTERIAAKKNVGWETQYDESERDALRWALDRLEVVRARPQFPRNREIAEGATRA